MHNMMGLPMEGDDLSRMPYCETENEILEEWKAQYVDKKYHSEAYVKHIRSIEEHNVIFRLNFLILFINTFIESMVGGTNNIKVVEKLVLVKDFSKIDWCKYMLDSLRSRNELWIRDDKTCYYLGPITLLLLSYVYYVRFENIKLDKMIPFIAHVKGDKLIQIQEFEIKFGGFGMQFRDSSLNDARMGCEEEEEECELYGDIEAFAAVLEHFFGKLLAKNSKMEVALKDGLKKITDNKVLKECVIKKNELFNENDYDKENDNENDIPYHGKEIVEYQGDLSPIRGLVRKSKDVDEGCSYVAPRTENEITHDDLTMTRFYKLPGVMDEMIDMATKTKIMFSSSKRVEEEENPTYCCVWI
ncbi:unnamed protein product [Lactuca saligna]|uniref:Uncharacterized protein n=1 Tax=Lactuca saligna TaxID=75948 RepID=A0AA36E1K1_LACSI|nr:unnamed protein product [Lactuca saligna]